eukprot:5520324-Pleurochrysis_carterae.AAC.1
MRSRRSSSYSSSPSKATSSQREPKSLCAADSNCRSDSTSTNDDFVPPAESLEPAPLAGETFRVGDAYPPTTHVTG